MIRTMNVPTPRAIKYKKLLEEHRDWLKLKKKDVPESDIMSKLNLSAKRLNYIKTKNSFIHRNNEILPLVKNLLKKGYSVDVIAERLNVSNKFVLWLIEVYKVEDSLFNTEFDYNEFYFYIQKGLPTKDIREIFNISQQTFLNTKSILKMLNQFSLKEPEQIEEIKIKCELSWTVTEENLFNKLFETLYTHYEYSIEQISDLVGLNCRELRRFQSNKSIHKESNYYNKHLEAFYSKLLGFLKYGLGIQDLQKLYHLSDKQRNFFYSQYVLPVSRNEARSMRLHLAKKVEALTKSRKTSREIASELNISFAEVQNIRALYQIKSVSGSAKKYSYELIQSIANCYVKEKLTAKEIATELNLPESVVKSIIVNSKIRKNKSVFDEELVPIVHNLFCDLKLNEVEIAEKLSISINMVEMIISVRNIVR